MFKTISDLKQQTFFKIIDFFYIYLSCEELKCQNKVSNNLKAKERKVFLVFLDDRKQTNLGQPAHNGRI